MGGWTWKEWGPTEWLEIGGAILGLVIAAFAGLVFWFRGEVWGLDAVEATALLFLAAVVFWTLGIVLWFVNRRGATRLPSVSKDEERILNAPPPKWSEAARRIASGFVYPAGRVVGQKPASIQPQWGFRSAVDAIQANGHPEAGKAWREWFAIWDPQWTSAHRALEQEVAGIHDRMSRNELERLFQAYAKVVERLRELRNAMQNFGALRNHPAVGTHLLEAEKALDGLLARVAPLNDELRAIDGRLTFP